MGRVKDSRRTRRDRLPAGGFPEKADLHQKPQASHFQFFTLLLHFFVNRSGTMIV
jgi:hypothetical protein